MVFSCFCHKIPEKARTKQNIQKNNISQRWNVINLCKNHKRRLDREERLTLSGRSFVVVVVVVVKKQWRRHRSRTATWKMNYNCCYFFLITRTSQTKKQNKKQIVCRKRLLLLFKAKAVERWAEDTQKKYLPIVLHLTDGNR
jgi:hypothetical protein